MRFEEYMENEIPNYKDFISDDKLNELKEMYSDYLTYFNAARENIKSQFNSKANLDFTTEYEKNQERAIQAKIKLNKQIRSIKSELGFEEEQEKHMTW